MESRRINIRLVKHARDVQRLLLVALLGFAVASAYAQESASGEQRDQSKAQDQQPDQESGTYTFTFERMANEPEGSKESSGNETKQGSTTTGSPSPKEETAQPQGPNAPPASSQNPTPVETIPVQPTDQAKKEEPPPAPARESQPEELGTVVVTATKREQSVREIPQSISVLYGKELEAIGARELSDYLNRIPGISIQEGNLPERRKIGIRGVVPGDGTNQTTGQFFGDVPLTDPFSAFLVPDVDPFDLQDVEVLKGPQGTLFGGTALNGAIRWVPNKPEFQQWSGRTFADYVSIKEGDSAPAFGGAGNVPIGDAAALRFVGVLQHAPGVIDNLRLGVKDADSRFKWMGRAMGRWEPTDRLRLNAFYLRQQTRIDDLPLTDNTEGRLSSNDRPGPSIFRQNFDVANLDARYAFDWSTVVAQTSRMTKTPSSNLDFSNSNPGGTMGVEDERAAQNVDVTGYLNELRLVSPEGGGPWNWVGGVFFQNFNARTHSEFFVPNTGAAAPLAGVPGLDLFFTQNGANALGADFQPLKAREKAVYGEITRQLGERWELTAGGRYFRTGLDATTVFTGVAGPAFTVDPNNPNPQQAGMPVNSRQRENGFNPKGAVKFKLNRHLSTYATVVKGFQFGGFNVQPTIVPTEPIPLDYKSSSLRNIELGVRTDWLDRTLRFDLTVFHIKWTDAQIKVTTPTLQNEFIDNVGAVTSKGLESTLAYLTPIPGLSLNFVSTFSVAKTDVPFSSGGRTAPTGTLMPNAPKFQAATTIAYNLPLGPWVTNAELLHSLQSKSYDNIFHDNKTLDFQTLDLRLGVSRPDIRFAPAVTLGVTNITNKHGLLGTGFSQSSAVLAQSVEGIYNRPRTISLRLTAGF